MNWTRGPRIVVRLLGMDGSYPSFEVRSRSHLYVPSSELTWMAVAQPRLPDEWWSGEINWLTPEEIRLMSALSLCERNPWNIGYPVIGRGASSYLPMDGQTDLSSKPMIARLAEAASQLKDEARARSRMRRNIPDGSYEVRDIGSADDVLAILDGIDPTDQLLIAGLARFLGGSRLMLVLDEREEAALSFYVSMGAALEFIRLWLCDQEGRDNVGFDDVYEYLGGVYPQGNEIAEVFRDLYEERLMAIHPANRLGEFWAPPLMADDLFWLRKHLLVLYRHIALGEEPCLGQ